LRSDSARSEKRRFISAFGLGDAVGDAREEGLVVPALGGDAVAQDRVGGQRREHLAGEGGAEGHDLARAEEDPLRVRAGEQEDAVPAGVLGEEARDLGLLAAHDVGGVGLREAGDDADLEVRPRGRASEAGVERLAGTGA
jgi:hypothetical protein